MKKEVFNIGNNTNVKLEVSSLKIGNNVMIYNESFVVLKNITGVSLGKEPPKAYPGKVFIAAFIGVLLVFSFKWFNVLVGLVTLTVCAIIIYSIYEYNLKLLEYIMLHLNSGKILFLKSPNHQFSIRVMDTIINCINSNEEFKIDFNSCTIHSIQNFENNFEME